MLAPLRVMRGRAGLWPQGTLRPPPTTGLPQQPPDPSYPPMQAGEVERCTQLFQHMDGDRDGYVQVTWPTSCLPRND